LVEKAPNRSGLRDIGQGQNDRWRKTAKIK